MTLDQQRSSVSQLEAMVDLLDSLIMGEASGTPRHLRLVNAAEALEAELEYCLSRLEASERVATGRP